MREKLATTLKVTLALVLSVLVSGAPLTPAYALVEGEQVTETQNVAPGETQTPPEAEETTNESVNTEETATSDEVVAQTTTQETQQRGVHCIDAKNAQNVVFTWARNADGSESSNEIQVSLKDNRPACETTKIYLSSYTMPDTWDGAGFNPSASPQTLFDSDSLTFYQNPVLSLTYKLKVKLPGPCKNAQVDLYYAPELKTVTYPTGHGTQNIIAKFVKRPESCVPKVKPCPAVTPTTTITKDSQFADYNGRGIVNGQDTRTAGHYEFTDNGLRIYTDNATSQAKVAWYHGVAFPLSDAGEPVIEYTGTNPAPGLQMVVDFDGNGTPDGILVGEAAVYGNDWWTPNSSEQFVKDGAPSHAGGSGSANHGTLSQWLGKFPNAKVVAVGFSLGSGVKGDGVIKSLTFGCVTYEFKKPVDVCPNLEGVQATVPEGYVKVDDGTCIKPGQGGGTPETPTTPATPSTPQVLGATTTAAEVVPATIPATGASSGMNPLYMILASLAAYGIVYFAGQRRSLNKTNV